MANNELKKIIGSQLILGFEGKSLSDSCRNFLEEWDLGGVILFKRNMESPEQVLELNQSIRRAAKKIPIISVDHEGGNVFRLPPPFKSYPFMGEIGAVCQERGNFNPAYEVGKLMGEELLSVGFNVNYAPVLDVHTHENNPIIGKRAFASEPHLAAQGAMAYLQGLQSTGVLGCGKHFPGHGDTETDSHLELPIVKKDRNSLEACELIPFKIAIQNQIPMLMTAHVLYPAWDEKLPATLSPTILTELLRKKLNFNGLILSDDFFMKGIAGHWGLEEAVEMFFRAGGDLALLCHQEEVQRRVAAYLYHLAETDRHFFELMSLKAEKMNQFRYNFLNNSQFFT